MPRFVCIYARQCSSNAKLEHVVNLIGGNLIIIHSNPMDIVQQTIVLRLGGFHIRINSLVVQVISWWVQDMNFKKYCASSVVKHKLNDKGISSFCQRT